MTTASKTIYLFQPEFFYCTPKYHIELFHVFHINNGLTECLLSGWGYFGDVHLIFILTIGTNKDDDLSFLQE